MADLTASTDVHRRDIRILFATRFARMFAYGLVSVVLVLYLTRIGISERVAGLLLSLTLAGDLIVSLWMTTRADRLGRRRMLAAGALLMAMAGSVFVSTVSFPILLIAAVVGVISPGGTEVGPFLPIEQAAISEEVEGDERTRLFAWYNLIGSIATALGALLAGWGVKLASGQGAATGGDLVAYRLILGGYSAIGLVLFAGFVAVSKGVESRAVPTTKNAFLGLGQSRGIVLRLGGLFAVDAFAGGLVLQGFVAYWLVVKFGADAGEIGTVFFFANLLSGFSGLVAARLAKRFGLVNTMVFTHIPSNVLLMAVPLMPTLGWAVTVLLARFSISQMDVPTRQSLVASVVTPGERSAAGGVTNVFRSCGTMLAPVLAGAMLSRPQWFAVPFFAAGGLKIVYDLMLLVLFRKTGPMVSPPTKLA